MKSLNACGGPLKKLTRTVTETREVWVIRRGAAGAGATGPDSCAVCGPSAAMLAPEAAATLSALSTRAVYALVESGRAHFAECPDGALYVCLSSLSEAARHSPPPRPER